MANLFMVLKDCNIHSYKSQMFKSVDLGYEVRRHLDLDISTSCLSCLTG